MAISLKSACDRVFGFSDEMYRRLAKAGHLPAPVAGKIDLEASAKALIEYYRKLARGSGSLSLTDERTRLTKLQADLAEIELAKRNGDVIPYSDALTAWTKAMGAMKTRLLGIPTKYAPLLFGRAAPEIQAIIDGAVREALAELDRVDYAQSNPAALDGGVRNAEATRKNDRQRLGRRRKTVKRRIKR